jgi:hypothetical protein
MKAPLPMQSGDEKISSGDPEFLQQTCIPFLRQSQNTDGGWGFSAWSGSRVEPTSWALLGLSEFASTDDLEQIDRGLNFLRSAQLPDGSWASAPGQTEGSWVTALACWALGAAGSTHSQQESQRALQLGLKWLSNERPADGGAFRRFVRRLVADKTVVAQNEAYYGWSWTSGTASWVEPTSYALLVLRRFAPPDMLATLGERIRLAESMLLDRTCPGGGWNCGNPMVYGVAGQPQIGPTAWALLALREQSNREEVRGSVEWLADNWRASSTPGSLALADICLRFYGASTLMMKRALCNAYSNDDAMWTVPDAAWSVLAMSPTEGWLKAPTLVNER